VCASESGIAGIAAKKPVHCWGRWIKAQLPKDFRTKFGPRWSALGNHVNETFWKQAEVLKWLLSPGYLPEFATLETIVRSSLERRTVTIIFWILALATGGLSAWATRYEVDPDTISYLDMADAYLRGDWSMALNGQWNPFYAWLLCLMQLLVKPDPYWEFPAVTGLNFVIYVVGLPCLHFFLRQLANYTRKLNAQPGLHGSALMPPWALFAFGYILYILNSQKLLSTQGADLCIANFLYLAFGLLLWIGTEPTRWRPFVLLGLVLGLSYLTKAIMFPLTFVFIVISVCLGEDLRKTLARGMLAFLVFAVVAGPFIAALSESRGRFTYSDTGKYNYALFICMGPPLNYPWIPPYFHWQGDIPNCGTPSHPVRRIYATPAVYEFGTPFHATYGAWYDPSYWYEGVVPYINFRNQIHVLLVSLEKYFNWIVHDQPVFIVGLVILAWMRWTWRYRAKALMTRWLWLVPAVAALSLYGIVHVEFRFIAPYVTILWLGLYMMGPRLPDSHDSRSLLSGVLVSMVLVILFSTVLPKSVYDVRAIVLQLNEANDEYVRVAKGLKELGIQPGDKVASIGHTFSASLWARMARVHIVAEITPKDTPDYWQADATTKAQVREILAREGVKAIVTDFPMKGRPSDDSDAHWQQIGNSSDKDHHMYYGSLLAR
jgi:hypothetical protein